jgi:hypothetical protein
VRDDFGVFILTHGRPAGVSATLGALRRARYTGKWWLVLDTDDETVHDYAQRWGAEHILTFDKDEEAKRFDLADNRDHPRGVIVYARNAAARLAAEMGLRYYMQLDDDYSYFAHRFQRGDTALLDYAYTFRFDDVLEAFVDFLEDSGALTVAFAQGGDYIGGLPGDWSRVVVKRKAMNTFIARVDRPIDFVGRINEDVNTYVWRGGQGDLFLTMTDFMVEQKETQSQGGGMTGAYVDGGTYVKSFYSVLFNPSCVKVATLGEAHDRLHHQIAWNNAVPKIVSGSHHRAA